MSIELTISHFREYARQVLDEHSGHLKAYNNNNSLLDNKFERLKFFNKHLKLLKKELKAKSDMLLAEQKDMPYYEGLEKGIHSASIEYIDEYLSIGFSGSDKRKHM